LPTSLQGGVGIAIIRAVLRQQHIRIDRAFGLDRRAFMRGHGGDDFAERRVGLAFRHQHAHDRQGSGGVAVHEVHFHRKAPAGDQVLARPMEVVLQRHIAVGTDGERAALAEVELNSVPVVENSIALLAPGDLERRKLRLDGAADIEGRLLRSDRTGLVQGIHVAPVAGAGFAFSNGALLRRSQRTRKAGITPPRKRFKCMMAIHDAPRVIWCLVGNGQQTFRRATSIDTQQVPRNIPPRI
jgi:hypothetical protein